MSLPCAAVSLGTIPGEGTLAQLPTFESGDGSSGGDDDESPTAWIARQTSSLMALLNCRDKGSVAAKASQVWLGEGLGSLPKRTYDRMVKWEFMDMAEFRPRTITDRTSTEGDTEKLVALPEFEVTQAKKKPVNNIIVWTQCFTKYTAAMAKEFPECTPGFMSHMLTVLKAYGEVEDPAWCLYDEMYREKMASTGVKQWPGMDVQVYQEMCAGRPRKRGMGLPSESKGTGTAGGIKRAGVCWQFNQGSCSYGKSCKFPHVCENCRGNHPKCHCPNVAGAGKQQRLS